MQWLIAKRICVGKIQKYFNGCNYLSVILTNKKSPACGGTLAVVILRLAVFLFTNF